MILADIGNMHPAQLPISDLLKSCRETRTRGSGPGGQHRNKVETAITLTHLPTQIAGQASERRSQDANRQMAIQRLRIHLALGFRSLPNPAEFPARWHPYIKGGRVQINPENDEFPALLSDVLDRIQVAGGELKLVAERMGITASQLSKLLKIVPAAWLLVQQIRLSHDLPRIR